MSCRFWFSVLYFNKIWVYDYKPAIHEHPSAIIAQYWPTCQCIRNDTYLFVFGISVIQFSMHRVITTERCSHDQYLTKWRAIACQEQQETNMASATIVCCRCSLTFGRQAGRRWRAGETKKIARIIDFRFQKGCTKIRRRSKKDMSLQSACVAICMTL